MDKLIQRYLGELGLESFFNDQRISGLILVAVAVGTSVWRFIVWYVKRRHSERLKTDLHPFFSAVDIKKATQFYVPTHFQSNPPSQHGELIQANKVTARQRAIPFFVKHAFQPGQDHQRFYMVLAGSGMGKTTFMINLYLGFLIHSRFKTRRFHIKLLPLAYSDVLKRIDKIEDQDNTILLLDGLDEDPAAVRDYEKRMSKVLKRVQDFRVVVFTCRTQFFPSEEDEPRETPVVKFGTRQGFQSFAKMYLSPFSEKDIRLFLKKRYTWINRAKREQAFKIIEQSPNLMVRPMILSYIDDLLEDGGKYDFTSDLYHVLIQKWINREADRVKEDRRTKFREELFRFSQAIAVNIYKNRGIRKGMFISQKEIRPFAEKHKIQLDEIEMRSRSLLNRNMDGQYKFAHKSILEYFLALACIENPDFGNSFNFVGMDLARVFFGEMCLRRETKPCFENLAGEGKAKVNSGLEKDVSKLPLNDLQHITSLSLQKLRDVRILIPLQKLQHLHLNQTQIRSLKAISDMSELKELAVSKTDVEDLSPLSELDKLESLHLDHTNISDLNPLRTLNQLRNLSCSFTGLRSIDALYELRNLEKLSLHHTQIKDIGPLRKLTNLRWIWLNHTGVHALNPLRNLAQLETLDLSYTKAQNLTPLAKHMALRDLGLACTEIHSLAPLVELPLLERVNLDKTQIADVLALRGSKESLRQLSLRHTRMVRLDTLTQFTGLEKLYLDSNDIADVAPLADLIHLRSLSLRQTKLQSLRPLHQIRSLEQLELTKDAHDPTEIKALQAALPKCKLVFK
ncbi:MAG: leucine-rich repeat domain-containing protein [Bacteroidota bacterium]